MADDDARATVRAILTALANDIPGEEAFPGDRLNVYDAREWLYAWRDAAGALMHVASEAGGITEHEALTRAYDWLGD